MRTRTSPRNQEILWRDLGGEPKESKPLDRIESITAALNGLVLNKRTRRMLERDLERERIRRALAAAERDKQ